MLHQLATLGGPGLPLWLYEFAVVAATAVGAGIPALRDAVHSRRSSFELRAIRFESGARPRNRAFLVLALIAVTVAVVFVFGRFSAPAAPAYAVEMLHLVSAGIALVGGNFVHAKWATERWRALYSGPALLLYAVVAFDYWYQHRSMPVADTPHVLRSPAVPADSTGAFRRITNALESGSAQRRLRVLHEALNSGDPSLRGFALSRALTSGDISLRSAALREAVRTSSELFVVIDESPSFQDIIETSLGKHVRIELLDHGSADGKFRIASGGPHATGSLSLSMESLSFTVPAGTMSGEPVLCDGHETLDSGAAELRGTMRCTVSRWNVRWTSSYDITTRVL